MIIALALAAIVADPVAILGAVQVGRGAEAPTVWLLQKSDGASLRLTGEITSELCALQSATVELFGHPQEGSFAAQSYRIVELSGGKPPTAVGTLVQTSDTGSFGLAVDDGPPLPLAASPKRKAALSGLLGSKLWIVGHKLLSGEIKVTRYGVLRKAVAQD